MTGESASRGVPLWLIVLLLLLAPFLCVAGWELLQGYRFDSRAARINEALVEFKSSAHLTVDAARHVSTEIRTNTPKVRVIMMGGPFPGTWKERRETWMLDFHDPGAHPSDRKLAYYQIHLVMKRSILGLRVLRLHKDGNLPAPPSDLLEATLLKHGVELNFSPWRE